MAAELSTPLDELTGIPLPILPQECIRSYSETYNWHHAWHAESAPELQGLGGKALRHSRVQLVRATDHNDGDKTRGKLTYHDFYIGPELPTEEIDQFNKCVISAAGYVPDEGIDLRTGTEPTRVRMSQQQIEWLRKPAKARRMSTGDLSRLSRRSAEEYVTLASPSVSKAAYMEQAKTEFMERQKKQALMGLHHIRYQYQPMRDFFREMILKQDIRHVKQHELKVEEFLQTRYVERKMHLGRWLLAQAVDVSTDQVRQPYNMLRTAGSLHPLMPVDPSALVIFKLGDREQRTQMVVNHEKQLRTSLGLAA